MGKRTGDDESDLPQKRVRFEDAGTPHRSEAASFAKRSLRLQQVSPMAPITAASVSFSVFLPDIQSSRSILVRCLVKSRVTISCTCNSAIVNFLT